MKINKKKLKSIISSFYRKNILVVGDLILDHHISGRAERISPEAPVPVVWANKESFSPGGAANVGLNIRALGAKVSICGVIGSDHFGSKLFSHIKDNKISSQIIVRDLSRPTTLKTRIIANNQQLVRVDWESVEPLSAKTNKMLLDKVRRHIDDFDAVIVEDYGKGVINPSIVEELVELCKARKKIITVDPKEEHFDYYENVTSLTPNLKEAQSAVNYKIRSKDEIPLLGKMIKERLNPDSLLITLGEDGMMLFVEDKSYHIPTAALEVYDVTGAGDTVISAFTLSLCCQAKYQDAAMIANFAAGIVVGKLGASTASKKELFNIIDEN
ncbi:MAG: D-glycero-beta-D-manno-heptose-7-phosphate kinase [Candidatus Omnitrophica bacterium]|nr:D-glycero-beta-D-manno-heptose-7-phosphate kinase [Candidatus Omnitrophota bacterium]